MIDVTEALRLVLDQTFNWGEETVPLSAAAGRVLHQEVWADRDQPPFDRVAMDGIAIAYTSYLGGQRTFPVAHFAPAGTAPRPLTNPAQCVEIMTGAPLPPGTSTVIRYEDLKTVAGGFRVPDRVVDDQSIHRRGKDGKAGDRLLSPGVRIGPAEVAVLATCGIDVVRVARWPRVAIASTGDEVVPVHVEPLPHQIRGSNVPQLAALFQEIGITPVTAHLPDDEKIGRARLTRLIAGADLLLLTGGVSKGKLDHVPEWLRGAGVQPLFHRVAQRPGKPLWVGRDADTMVFALPGNPVSSLVGTVVYVAAFLRRQVGLSPSTRRLPLGAGVTFAGDLRLFQRVRVEEWPAGPVAVPVAGNGSGDLVALVGTDGFLSLPRAGTHFTAGEVYDFYPLRLLP